MRSESNSASPSGKRSRDPEDEIYVDNLNSHKRYLSEMMASSLNGLTVGDAMPETIMDSPARSESMCYPRDEMSLQYSPMSEDLDDMRYYETPMSACSSQSESRPTSPVSPYRYKPMGACCSPPSTSLPSSEPRQRGSDTEARFPSSPSDICHSSDLRKTALLRSVQMRAQPSCSSSFDLGFNSGVETRTCSYLKPLGDVRENHGERCSSMGSYMKPLEDEHDYHLGGCSSMASSERSFNGVQEPMKALENEPLSEPVFTPTPDSMLSIQDEPLSCSYMKPLDDGCK
ncbi:hypothetical protein KSS87_016817 [Heliosperma pusillum]|nr:hypothetical protein KSS87_016817 [Heliosperma pusillum]